MYECVNTLISKLVNGENFIYSKNIQSNAIHSFFDELIWCLYMHPVRIYIHTFMHCRIYIYIYVSIACDLFHLNVDSSAAKWSRNVQFYFAPKLENLQQPQCTGPRRAAVAVAWIASTTWFNVFGAKHSEAWLVCSCTSDPAEDPTHRSESFWATKFYCSVFTKLILWPKTFGPRFWLRPISFFLLSSSSSPGFVSEAEVTAERSSQERVKWLQMLQELNSRAGSERRDVPPPLSCVWLLHQKVTCVWWASDKTRPFP